MVVLHRSLGVPVSSQTTQPIDQTDDQQPPAPNNLTTGRVHQLIHPWGTHTHTIDQREHRLIHGAVMSCD